MNMDLRGQWDQKYKYPAFLFHVTVAGHAESTVLSAESPLHPNTNLRVAGFQRCERKCQPWGAGCYAVLLFFSRYCKNENVYFLFVFMYVLLV